MFSSEWWKDNVMNELLNEVNVTPYDEEVTEKVIKGFKLQYFQPGFGRSYISKMEKASPKLANDINKWIKKEFPRAGVRVSYEKNKRTVNFLYPKDKINEITVNKPIPPLEDPERQAKKQIKDIIIEYIQDGISYCTNERIIDNYMSDYMSSNIEDIITDYVKHKMLSDEDIDMDSEEINSLDRDAIIEYINNNKPLQSYLCNKFWKYYMELIKPIIPELAEDCWDELRLNHFEPYNEFEINRAVEKIMNSSEEYHTIIKYPIEIIGNDDEFYSYLYNELTKDNNLNEITINKPSPPKLEVKPTKLFGRHEWGGGAKYYALVDDEHEFGYLKDNTFSLNINYGESILDLLDERNIPYTIENTRHLNNIIRSVLIDKRYIKIVEDTINEIQLGREPSPYQEYIKSNEDKIEAAAEHFNYPIPDIQYAFFLGKEVVLSDSIWDKLENSQSHKISSLEDAIKLFKKENVNPKPYIDAIRNEEQLPLPLIFNYNPDKYYLVGGDLILSLYKALKVIPVILMATLDLQDKKEMNVQETELKEQEQEEKDHDKNLKKELKGFLKFAIKELNISNPPSGLTLSKDQKQAKTKHTFGYFQPETKKIWVYVKGRNTADILRTLAHELIHLKQAEEGRIDYNSGDTGSPIENEANAMAGVLLRKYGKKHENIYEVQVNKPIHSKLKIYYKTKDDGGIEFYYIPAGTDIKFTVLASNLDKDKDGNPMYWISSTGFLHLPKHIQNIAIEKNDGFHYIPEKYIHIEQNNLNEVSLYKEDINKDNIFPFSYSGVIENKTDDTGDPLHAYTFSSSVNEYSVFFADMGGGSYERFFGTVGKALGKTNENIPYRIYRTVTAITLDFIDRMNKENNFNTLLIEPISKERKSINDKFIKDYISPKYKVDTENNLIIIKNK